MVGYYYSSFDCMEVCSLRWMVLPWVGCIESSVVFICFLWLILITCRAVLNQYIVAWFVLSYLEWIICLAKLILKLIQIGCTAEKPCVILRNITSTFVGHAFLKWAESIIIKFSWQRTQITLAISYSLTYNYCEILLSTTWKLNILVPQVHICDARVLHFFS